MEMKGIVEVGVGCSKCKALVLPDDKDMENATEETIGGYWVKLTCPRCKQQDSIWIKFDKRQMTTIDAKVFSEEQLITILHMAENRMKLGATVLDIKQMIELHDVVSDLLVVKETK